jgi:hypothetical protein
MFGRYKMFGTTAFFSVFVFNTAVAQNAVPAPYFVVGGLFKTASRATTHLLEGDLPRE